MFERIVIPVDLTDRHDRVLEMAADLVRPGRGEVILLHVIELVTGMPREEAPEFYRKLEVKARAALERMGQRLGERKVAWRAEISYGRRAEEIARRASELKADLLLLASHRIDLERPTAGWGTESYKIGILAQCPVMLVK